MLDHTNQANLLDIRGVCRSFSKGSGEDLLVLENVDLIIHSGEIVGLLGRSGSGKSTLLHIIAGPIAPSSATFPMAATSAAIFSVLVINNSKTTPLSTIGGNAVLMLAASPLPVTRPICAHMDWIAAINGLAKGIVQSMLRPN